MSCIPRFTKQLRTQGFRITPQRMAILQVLHDGGHLTPSQVYERASQVLPGLTEATVYRTLEFMAQNNLALAAHVGSGKMVYELAGHDHHHLICRDCGKAMQIDHKLLQKLYMQLEADSGYRLTTSHLTIFGLCPRCQKINRLP